MCIYVCVCMYSHVCMYTCMHMYECMHACMHVCMHSYMHVHTSWQEEVQIAQDLELAARAELEGLRYVCVRRPRLLFFFLNADMLVRTSERILLHSKPILSRRCVSVSVSLYDIYTLARTRSLPLSQTRTQSHPIPHTHTHTHKQTHTHTLSLSLSLSLSLTRTRARTHAHPR